MTGSVASVALGVALVLLVGALASSAALEGLRRLFNRRERYLFRNLGELLDGTPDPGPDSRTVKLYRTTEFQTAVTGRERALMDGRRTTLRPWIGNDECSRLRNFGPRRVRPGMAGAALCRVNDEAGSPWAAWPAEDRGHVEPVAPDEAARAATWFDDAMHPVTEAYKAQTRGWLFALGLVLAVAANVDVLAIGQTLWDEPEAQSRIDAIAAVCDGAADVEEGECEPVRLSNELRSIRLLPLGWPCPADAPAAEDAETGASVRTVDCAFTDRFSGVGWLTIVGWLLTAFGVMLGAPFWFDVVQRTLTARRAA